MPDALKTGAPGSFDDDMIWTVSVTRARQGFVMLYTALSSVEARITIDSVAGAGTPAIRAADLESEMT